MKKVKAKPSQGHRVHLGRPESTEVVLSEPEEVSVFLCQSLWCPQVSQVGFSITPILCLVVNALHLQNVHGGLGGKRSSRLPVRVD